MSENAELQLASAVRHMEEAVKDPGDAKRAVDHLYVAVRLLNGIILADYEESSRAARASGAQGGNAEGDVSAERSVAASVATARKLYPRVYAKLSDLNFHLPPAQRVPLPRNALDTERILREREAREARERRETDALVSQMVAMTLAEARSEKRADAYPLPSYARRGSQAKPQRDSSFEMPKRQARQSPSSDIVGASDVPDAAVFSRAPKPPAPGTWMGLNLPEKYSSILERSGLDLDEELARDLVSDTHFPRDLGAESPDPFDAVIGQTTAKAALENALIFPRVCPELFKGNRQPPSSILLIGPPGCGKTFMLVAAAEKACVPMVSVSASTIISKWVGDSEKRLRALFAYCRALGGPRRNCIMFLDEVDSILTSRSGNEQDYSRKVKTEFFTLTQGVMSANYSQGSGAGGVAQGNFVLVGATNRPMDLDDAALRRFEARILVSLPGLDERRALLRKLLAVDDHSLTERDIESVAKQTEGYSYSDLTQLVKKAAMLPVNALPKKNGIPMGSVPPISKKDYEEALKAVRPSVSGKYMRELEGYMTGQQGGV